MNLLRFSTVYVCSAATITWVCQVDSIMPWIFMNEHDISPASCLCRWLMQQREGSLHVQMTTRLVLRPYIYRRPCALQVQAKANIVLIKLNYESKKQTWWGRCLMTGGGEHLDVNCIDWRDFLPPLKTCRFKYLYLNPVVSHDKQPSNKFIQTVHTFWYLGGKHNSDESHL